MTVLEYLGLSLAAFVGGALNAVAGGGSFLTFPALVVAGVLPINANATSAVALWPASLASAVAYRRELDELRAELWLLGAVSAAGAGLGAYLLLGTSNAAFMRLIPYLLLLAALVFSFGGGLVQRLRAARSGQTQTRTERLAGASLQFLIAIYGGYFGGGMGIMMLAVYALLGMTDMHRMNGLKNAISVVINLIAVIAFVVAGAVAFYPALVMAASAILGGYTGAAFARRIAPARVRRFVLVVAWTLTSYFFVKVYV